MDLSSVFLTLLKIAFLIFWIWALLWGMGKKTWSAKLITIGLAFAVIQALIIFKPGGNSILTDFDTGLLFQAISMIMVCLGLNLIYGINGQFSLAQWAFYGLGAYAAADITYRWGDNDASGLFVLGFAVIFVAFTILVIRRWLSGLHRVPVLSSFTIYLIGIAIAAAAAAFLGNWLAAAVKPLFGTPEAPGFFASVFMLNVIFFFSILLAGLFAAEVSFLFGLPVLSLGSDYFGIATLGFAIVVMTLMVNSDTILGFQEMKGGRGMIGIPRLTSWPWVFVFLIGVIVLIRNYMRSSTGRATMAVRDDEIAARAMGIDIASNKLLTFVTGSFVAGIGGALYAHYIGFLSPNSFNFIQSFNPLIIVVFGGLGSMTGTLVATIAWIFLLEALLRVLLGQLGTEAPTWRFVLYPITLLLFMLLKPSGILGTREWGFFKAATLRSKYHQFLRPHPKERGNENENVES